MTEADIRAAFEKGGFSGFRDAANQSMAPPSITSVGAMGTPSTTVSTMGSPDTSVNKLNQFRQDRAELQTSPNETVRGFSETVPFAQQLQPIDVTSQGLSDPSIFSTLQQRATSNLQGDPFGSTSALELEDLGRQQDRQKEQQLEELNRLGILRDGDTVGVLGDMSEAQNRERLQLLGNQETRSARGFDQGLALGGQQSALAQARGSQALTGQGLLLDREGTQGQLALGARGQDLDSLLGARGQDVSLRGQDLSEDIAIRGQDVTQRGQDINELLTGRGQDITQRGQDLDSILTGRGQDVTARGQDVSSLVAGRGQDVTARGQDIGQNVAQRGQDVTQRGQDLNSLLGARGQDVTARGQDIGQSVSERGQDLNSLLTGRGQDVTARGQDITGRGQDLSSALGQRGQDITSRGQDINQGLGQGRLTLDEALGNQKDVTLNRGIDADIADADARRSQQNFQNIMAAAGLLTGKRGDGGDGFNPLNPMDYVRAAGTGLKKLKKVYDAATGKIIEVEETDPRTAVS
tara:strand:- start:818 stop:2383 length:1566 start_codon:yes stop_codon:yes gene_type:complete